MIYEPKTLDSFGAWRRSRSRTTVVVTNGCFDILHAGHVDMLEYARSLGDYLVVGMNSDESVRKLKGDGRPVNSQADRAKVLQALRCVEHVVVFEGTRCPRFLKVAQPDIYVKAGDYTLETLDKQEHRVLVEHETKIVFSPLLPGRSTTSVLAHCTTL